MFDKIEFEIVARNTTKWTKELQYVPAQQGSFHTSERFETLKITKL